LVEEKPSNSEKLIRSTNFADDRSKSLDQPMTRIQLKDAF